MAVDDVPQTTGSIEDVIDGQKMILWAILLYIVTVIIVTSAGEVFGLVGIGVLVLAIMGLLKLSDGLGYSTGIKVLLIVLLFVPLIGFLTLAIVNGKATQTLKASGYKVGLMGARKP